MTTIEKIRWPISAGIAVLLVVAACKKAPEPFEQTIVVRDKTAVIRLSAGSAYHARTLVEITKRLLARVGDSLDAQQTGSDIARVNTIGRRFTISSTPAASRPISPLMSSVSVLWYRKTSRLFMYRGLLK